MPRGFEGERESQRANDPTGGGFGGMGQASRGTRGMDRAALDRVLGTTTPARTEPGQRGQTAAANEAQFFAERGITATNPYGKQGFFSRMFGIDPSNIDYSNIMSPEQRSGVAALAYDRYANPFAEVNVLGNPTGANPELGIVRSGLKAGDVTALGTVKSVAQPKSPMIKGIASFLPGVTTANILNALMPAPTVNMIEGAGMAGTGIPSAFAEQERMGRRTERMGEYSQPSGLGQMVSNMMSFFSPNQQTTNIQPSDVSTNMSAYSETGRPISGVPQLGVTSYGSPMAQVTAPATAAPSYGSPMAQVTAPASTRSYSSTPNRADMMAFELGNIAPSASSQVTVAPNQATAPKSSLTMKSVPSDYNTLDLESAYLSGNLTPEAQAGIAAELQKRAERGDAMAQSSLTMIGYEEAAPASMSGTPVPPARPGRFLGSAGQPLNLIPSSLDILGNPAL